VLFSSPALAQSYETAYETGDLRALQNRLEQQQGLIQEQQKLLRHQQEQLSAQQREFEAMKRRLNQISSSAPTTPSSNSANIIQQEKKFSASDSAPQTTQEVATDRKQVAQSKLPEITLLDNQAGVLLQKGRFVLEPGIEYSNSSATRVDIEGFTIIPALTIGAFQISEVNRDAVTARLTGRLGLTNRLEVDASVPYIYRNDRTRARPFGVGASADRLTEVNGNDIGDVELGAHYQLNYGRQDLPVFIANARFKTTTGTGPFEVPIDPATGLQQELPTGSGFYAFEPSLTGIFPSDPVVFFGNLGYLFNMEEDFGGNIGTINPGDSVNGSAGLSLAMNDKTSMSFSYSHNMVFETEQNGDTIPDSTILQVGSLNIGASYKLRENTSLNFIASAGVTEDAPDIRLMFKVPISFTLY
jgi:hypothetical protein